MIVGYGTSRKATRSRGFESRGIPKPGAWEREKNNNEFTGTAVAVSGATTG